MNTCKILLQIGLVGIPSVVFGYQNSIPVNIQKDSFDYFIAFVSLISIATAIVAFIHSTKSYKLSNSISLKESYIKRIDLLEEFKTSPYIKYGYKNKNDPEYSPTDHPIIDLINLRYYSEGDTEYLKTEFDKIPSIMNIDLLRAIIKNKSILDFHKLEIIVHYKDHFYFKDIRPKLLDHTFVETTFRDEKGQQIVYNKIEFFRIIEEVNKYYTKYFQIKC